MPVAEIHYNASTGNNAHGGGQAPATAVTGSSGSATAATTTFDLGGTFDLTGVNDDDTDILYVQGNSGDRHLFRITAYTFTTDLTDVTAVTTNETFDSTISSATWGIGGTRLNFWGDTSNHDLQDYTAGWHMILADDAIYTLPVSATPLSAWGGGNTTDGPLVIRSETGDTAAVQWSENAALFDPNLNVDVEFRNLAITKTGGTNQLSAIAINVRFAGENIRVLDCVISSSAPCINVASGSTRLILVRSTFTSSATSAGGANALSVTNGRCYLSAFDCNFHDSPGDGVHLSGTNFSFFSFIGCGFHNNTGAGLYLDASAMPHSGVYVKNCALHNNIGAGCEIEDAVSDTFGPFVFLNNGVTDNGSPGGIVVADEASGGDAGGRTSSLIVYADWNAYGSNTGGARGGSFPAGANDVTLTADPYVDGDNGDFTLNATAGGGPLMLDAGFGRTGAGAPLCSRLPTTPLCSIFYNASTGSNTAASGSQMPTVAVTGTNGDISGTTFTLNGTFDFTQNGGVAEDGTDVLWIDTPTTERHLFRIASSGFNPNASACTSITTIESPTATRTGDNWAVGGTREDWDNDTGNPDIEDGLGGWEFVLETGSYSVATASQPYDLSGVGDATDGPLIIRSSTGDPADVDMDFTATNTDCFLFTGAGTSAVDMEGITFTRTNTGSTSRLIRAQSSNELRLFAFSCVFDGVATTSDGNILDFAGNNSKVLLLGCELVNGPDVAGSAALTWTNNRASFFIVGGEVHTCGEFGIEMASNTSLAGYVIDDNVVRDCTDDGIFIDWVAQHAAVIVNNVIHDNQDGLYIDQTIASADGPVFIVNNIFTENSRFGVGTTAGEEAFLKNAFADNNAFRNNTSGQYEPGAGASGANDVTLTADPYVNAASDNYDLNDTAGGGAACQETGLGEDGWDIGITQLDGWDIGPAQSNTRPVATVSRRVMRNRAFKRRLIRM